MSNTEYPEYPQAAASTTTEVKEPRTCDQRAHGDLSPSRGGGRSQNEAPRGVDGTGDRNTDSPVCKPSGCVKKEICNWLW